MKLRTLLSAVLVSFSLPLSALAVSAPYVGTIPSSVDANDFTIIVYTQEGAKISIVGGPSQIAPVTDGAGNDAEDGEVEVTVGLAQDTVNIFSITAELNGDTSDAVVVQIKEVTKVQTGGGDHTPPSAPTLSAIPDMVDTAQYMITGETEANANIYAYTTEGIVAGTTAADEEGYFQVTVELKTGKTNRINVTAEDEAGNEGLATQAVIRQTGDPSDDPAEDGPVPELYTSSQIFFGDTQGHWAKDYINQLYEDEVVSGKSKGIFDPNGLITRAELTKIAILAFGHSVNTTVKVHPFQDVPLNSWFAPFVEEAKRLGIVTGYPSGGFGPNDFITRAAALKIVLLAAGLTIEDNIVNEFTDVPDDAWYAGYVKFAAGSDVVSGYGDGRFGPGDNITRAAVAKIVVRALDLKNK